MEDWELPLATGNHAQQATGQINPDFSLNMPAHLNTRERYRYSEQRRMADPVDSYLGQQCVPAKSELSEPTDPYSFGTGTAYMLDADLYKKIKAEQWAENLYWEQPSCDNDVPNNPLWSPTPTPRLDTFIAQTAAPDTSTMEQRANDEKSGAQASETDKRNSRRRKRNTSIDHTAIDDKERRRIEHIVKNLEIFETQQKMYGRQQLKAIEDGVA
ncbi:uncharacterized protein Triagg1_495 [Trichoderma aggressivum f. europaeum]|uniref:Uncharacterized protein n=1 Tax=Trichoderma aggressivum f. europaeum TaxID=173218 RepID=A0AAE1JJ08_9HYPO|nr:hypothetical protein Triagg1_495 [Trichoderma aggressivum f. europaeum]